MSLLLMMCDPNQALALRPAKTVMQLERLGAFHQTRLSFVRSIIRKMMREQWRIECPTFALDTSGYGTVIYTIQTPHNERYSVVLFSQYLEDTRRSDRVIADAWDVAFALCVGHVSEQEVAELRANLPKQEAGRYQANVLVLSRANKSVRNFNYFVETLASGCQPDPTTLAQVGYLYRTTAVYGNGKFGIADDTKVFRGHAFATPFSAQMFTVYMLRHFSIQQVNHMARHRNPASAVPLDPALARYLGTGNATGLGMAPFLINHPKLINQWILQRETAIARVVHTSACTPHHCERFSQLLAQAQTHVAQIVTEHSLQAAENQQMQQELAEAQQWFAENEGRYRNGTSNSLWKALVEYAATHWRYETQEMVHSILLELYPELVDELETEMGSPEEHDLVPHMSLSDLKTCIEIHYDWALENDFDQPHVQHYFWYRSAEKEEPRLGERYLDPGDEKEVRLDIARTVRCCYDDLCRAISADAGQQVIHFLLRHPHHRGIIRRIQSMAQTAYGEIRANLLDQSTMPIHLLRCKLSFFGASKFDPKSSLWVRITLFQGAPLLSEIGQPFEDDWFLPIMPEVP